MTATALPEHPLRTERLTLRPAVRGDAELTWRYRRLDDVGTWLTRHHADLAAHRAHMEEPANLALTLVAQLGHEPDGPVIGDLMLRRVDAWGQAEVADRAAGTEVELGWVLDPAHRGLGYGTEAVRELLRYCFTELGVRRAVANCFLANEPSWRLMERVGMRREAHAVRDSLHRSGEWLDSLVYAVLAEEWEAATR
ncbi:Protein N-acetyltransferase, RimJ/RimL family [Georgenia satyanarayanai]|uniref:Protein N-acetyltransferase, RimJ/RimL family n=1 Tax=Georgenia satyanarayanai TaxID=860221 RepID=A0A2Y9A3J8_9MICO|nr:GNAT family protein [Georgenia satyanarayanai]PYG01974.1 RimJ/RimL family protein N-acetyltransferase [Georgenia satyanarayanai]SSA36777.1 Protein N-acetyltransferase, RimJ/RimL family [Georgenia satyanarayanai]